MHYNGPVVRPQTNASDIMLEVTVGCTYDGCKFCNFYKDYPFRMSELSQIEEDLQEVSRYNKNAKRVWAARANPFALSVEHLTTIGKLIRQYLPKAQISTYARINDFENKTVKDLQELHQLGYDDIVIGLESADDYVLTTMNKGYSSEDIIKQLTKLKEAGVPYRVIYLGGLAVQDRLEDSVRISASILNQFHPQMLLLTTVSVIPGTELFDELQQVIFKDATELERIKEFKELLAHLTNDINIFAETSTNMLTFTAQFPKDKPMIIQELTKVIDQFTDEDEHRLQAVRQQMTRV